MISLNPAKLNRCDWFIIVFVVYYLQGVLYPSGGIFSLGLLAINLMVSIYCAFKVFLFNNNPPFIKGLNLLLLMFTIYGVALIITSPSVIYYPKCGFMMKSYNYLKSIYLSLLPIYAFYYFTKKGYLTETRLIRWGFVFFISVILSYFRFQQEMIQKLADRGKIVDETTNNVGYLFLSLIPLLVLYRKKPLIQFAGLAIVMAFIVMGMKRGAIAIGAVVFVYFMWKAIKNSRGKSKFVFIILSLIICVFAVVFFIYTMANSDYMMKRVEATMEGNTSGRDNLYLFFWKYFTNEADALQYMFGRGANGTLEIYYNYAHNDWLEIAVNQGLIGVIIYAVYWICFFKTYGKATNSNAKIIFAISFFIFFSKTLFSMSYVDHTYVDTSVLGYALAIMYKSNKS